MWHDILTKIDESSYKYNYILIQDIKISVYQFTRNFRNNNISLLEIFHFAHRKSDRKHLVVPQTKNPP